MTRRTLYVVCGLVLVPMAALLVALATRFGLTWLLALVGAVALGLALRRPRREIAVVGPLSALVGLLLALVFFLLVWTGIVDSSARSGEQAPASVHDHGLAADHVRVGRAEERDELRDVIG